MFSRCDIVDADSTSVQAFGRGIRNVGVYQSSSERIRLPDGGNHFCTRGCLGLVPICHGFPDEAAIQPSFQPRASDSAYSGWWEEAETEVTCCA